MSLRNYLIALRESSFNMTRGGGGEDIEGGGAPKICILRNQQEREGS